MGIDLEIEMNKLGELPLYPPRRSLLDLLPTFLVSWLRRKYSWPKASLREQWAVSGLMLRVAYTTFRTAEAIEKVPRPFYLSETAAPEVDDSEPWKFN